MESLILFISQDTGDKESLFSVVVKISEVGVAPDRGERGWCFRWR